MSGRLDFGGPGGAGRPGGSGAPPERPSWRPPGRIRHGWLVGIVALIVLAWIATNTLRTHGDSSTGLASGARMPPFAAPLALGPLDGDVNVARHPDSGAAGRRPACRVRGPQIVNLCALERRGPVVLTFLATRGGDCTGELDRLETVRRGFPGVQVAAVAIRGDRGALRATIRAHGWRFPVAYDRDGVLANMYGVAVCPQTTFAYPGGRVRETAIGEESAATLRARFARLVRTSEQRGWRPPAGAPR